MKYDFDSHVDRTDTYSCKWDTSAGELPMWIADMDFKTSPEIRNALLQRLNNGIFGYSFIPDEWYQSYITWWKKRHDTDLIKDWLIFCNGVVPAISTAVRKFTTPAEKILIMSPVYNIFYNSINNNGRIAYESNLKYCDGKYSIDYDDLELKLSDPQTKMLLLCNPHNPIGKIWTKEELKKIGEMCYRNGVIVVSDEIHCDITDPDKKYVPFAGTSEINKNNSITCISPSKAFNIAGLQTAAVSIPNVQLRNRMNRALNTDEIAEPNAFAIDGTISAFMYSEHWLDGLNKKIFENKSYSFDYIRREIPEIRVVNSEATYLLWLDCSSFILNDHNFANSLRETTGLYVSDGHLFKGNGDLFIRINIASPTPDIVDGMKRLKIGVKKYIEKYSMKNK